jgi:CBS domain-containing protein
MITDRDIVVKCIAEGRDPAMCEVAELIEGPLFWISDDTDIMTALALMEEHKIRRVPVIDAQRKLCGMLSQADIATHLDNQEVGLFVAAISSGPAVQHAV